MGDALDQVLADDRFAALPRMLRELAYKYSYTSGRGERVLCWDHGRLLNHSCSATCLSPGFEFEIAVRDIEPGDEITDEYGTLNLEEPFVCLCGAPECRGTVRPDDPLRCAGQWDESIAGAFPWIADVAQPLWELVREKEAIAKVLDGRMALPSVMAHCRGEFAAGSGRSRSTP